MLTSSTEAEKPQDYRVNPSDYFPIALAAIRVSDSKWGHWPEEFCWLWERLSVQMKLSSFMLHFEPVAMLTQF